MWWTSAAITWIILINMGHLGLSGEAANTLCPVFGNHPSNPGTYARAAGLFLNIESPSQCHGNVTHWRFCYTSSGGLDSLHEIQFMVYRPNGSFTYSKVPSSTTIFRATQLSQEDCITISLNTSFKIQPNDLVAACISDNNDIPPLYVTSDRAARALRLQTLSNQCGESAWKVVRFPIRFTIEYVLLVEAIIDSSSAGCRAGHNRAGSSLVRIPGIFINVAFPAQCTGLVTSWNYCYYTTTQTSFAKFGVWRNETQSSSLAMIANSSIDITLEPQFSLASIVCKRVPLEPQNFFTIQQGDYVGVILPVAASIPILGMVSESNLLKHSLVADGIVLPHNMFTTLKAALHLYVDIDPGETFNTKTSQPIPSFTSVHYSSSTSANSTSFPKIKPSFQTTMSTLLSHNGGINEILLIPIVVIMIVGLLIIMVIIAALMSMIIRRQKQRTTSDAIEMISYTTVDGIENINYSDFNDIEAESAMHSHMSRKIGVKDEHVLYETLSDRHSVTASKLESSHIYASVNKYSDHNYSVIEQSMNPIYHELEPPSYQEPLAEESHLYQQIHSDLNMAQNVNQEDIKVLKFLGSGQFGNVYEGKWRKGNDTIKVALKQLKEGAAPTSRVKFLQEAFIMSQFDHDNVIKLLGMVLEDDPLMLVVEFAENGDLRKNLLEIRKECMDPSLPKLLLSFSRQIALGMYYLSSKKFIHRDLAARNILLSEDGLCKIADFGLSRDLVDDAYYSSSGGMIPVKWTAPEALEYKKYSTASDVWSYGCVLYEIWSLGHKPFENKDNMKVLQIISKGTRLPPPSGCPRVMYAAMIKCWHPEANSRPSFHDLVLTLTKSGDLLEVPAGTIFAYPEFKSPGGELKVGQKVYRDLQLSYANI